MGKDQGAKALNIKKVAGVDYSLSSPAISTFDYDTKEFHHYFYTDDTKLFSSGNFHGELHKLYRSEEERHDQISDWAMSHLKDCSYVMLEDYAFGARGRVFNIGENTGLLKHKLFKAGIHIERVDPKTLKKWAAGSGNAKKEDMEAIWMKEVGIDIRAAIGQMPSKRSKKLKMNPSSDIIDSYYLCKFMLFKLQNLG